MHELQALKVDPDLYCSPPRRPHQLPPVVDKGASGGGQSSQGKSRYKSSIRHTPTSKKEKANAKSEKDLQLALLQAVTKLGDRPSREEQGHWRGSNLTQTVFEPKPSSRPQARVIPS
ncbi:unnamed protein product [Leuciscus chuanchicus]